MAIQKMVMAVVQIVGLKMGMSEAEELYRVLILVQLDLTWGSLLVRMEDLVFLSVEMA